MNPIAIGSVSRRDCVKVAWHEVPGMVRKKRPVPQGRYDLLSAGRLQISAGRRAIIYRATVQRLTHNHPVPPGRVRLACLSRHFVPGYLHLVPTGHRRFVFSRLGRARLPKDRRFYQGLG
jgi:hypothetical protein